MQNCTQITPTLNEFGLAGHTVSIDNNSKIIVRNVSSGQEYCYDIATEGPTGIRVENSKFIIEDMTPTTPNFRRTADLNEIGSSVKIEMDDNDKLIMSLTINDLRQEMNGGGSGLHKEYRFDLHQCTVHVEISTENIFIATTDCGTGSGCEPPDCYAYAEHPL